MDESSCEDVRIQVSARIRPCPNLPSTQQCVRLDKQSPSSLFLMNDDNEQKKFDFDCVLGANVSQVCFYGVFCVLKLRVLNL